MCIVRSKGKGLFHIFVSRSVVLQCVFYGYGVNLQFEVLSFFLGFVKFFFFIS